MAEATAPGVAPDEATRERAVTRRQRRLLVAITVLWLPSALAAWAILSGRWLASPGVEVTRALLLAAIAIHTLVLLAGWLLVLRRLGRRRTPDPAPFSLEALQDLTPSEFEVWVQRAFQQRGYFVANTPDMADHGVDLRMVAPDGEPAIVQCKRYEGTVGEPAVRDLYGAMQHDGVPRGFLVTTGRFSSAAVQWAAGRPIELIDGSRLPALASSQPLVEP